MTPHNGRNRRALRDALDAYIHAMRPFVVDCLEKAKGKPFREVIAEMSTRGQYEQIRRRMSVSRNVLDAIDVNDLPILICRNWKGCFAPQFDHDRSFQELLWTVKRARNRVAHPSQMDLERDLDVEWVGGMLGNMAWVLGRIGRSDARSLVDDIARRLFAPGRQADVASALALAASVEDPGLRKEPDDRDTPEARHWVYEDMPTSRARIHESICVYCNDGSGLKGSRLPDNRWHGPFESLESAIGIALDTGHSDIRGCGFCLPSLRLAD